MPLPPTQLMRTRCSYCDCCLFFSSKSPKKLGRWHDETGERDLHHYLSSSSSEWWEFLSFNFWRNWATRIHLESGDRGDCCRGDCWWPGETVLRLLGRRRGQSDIGRRGTHQGSNSGPVIHNYNVTTSNGCINDDDQWERKEAGQHQQQQQKQKEPCWLLSEAGGRVRRDTRPSSSLLLSNRLYLTTRKKEQTNKKKTTATTFLGA